MPHYPNTGQTRCYDSSGAVIPCPGAGQDASFRTGEPWPAPRFSTQGPLAHDLLTGLVWTGRANHAGFPLTWQEALDHAADMARRGEYGRHDWRLPNRRELRSLICHQSRKPALPPGHPFSDVFLGWYWTSTSAAPAPAHAWYVHLEGGRMFYGRKDQAFLVWPVAGAGNGLLAATGQTLCHDTQGRLTACQGSGHDADTAGGAPWPRPRFQARGPVVIDRLTGLAWAADADLCQGPVAWQEAIEAAAAVELPRPADHGPWRLPTINELESLVDAGLHSPALPQGHPFINTRPAYWSSTSSAFEPDWAMALYLHKGAVGVGQKPGPHYHAWSVCSPPPGPALK